MSNFSYNSYNNDHYKPNVSKMNINMYDSYKTHDNFNNRNNNFSNTNLNDFDRKYRNKNNQEKDKYSTFYDYENISKEKFKNNETNDKYRPNKTLDNNFISNTLLDKNIGLGNNRNLSRNKDYKLDQSRKLENKSRSVSYDLKKTKKSIEKFEL